MMEDAMFFEMAQKGILGLLAGFAFGGASAYYYWRKHTGDEPDLEVWVMWGGLAVLVCSAWSLLVFGPLEAGWEGAVEAVHGMDWSGGTSAWSVGAVWVLFLLLASYMFYVILNLFVFLAGWGSGVVVGTSIAVLVFLGRTALRVVRFFSAGVQST